MTDTLQKISHLQAAIRQLAHQGRIKEETKERIARQVLKIQTKEASE